MALFNDPKDYELFMRANKELHELYFTTIDWWKRKPSSDFDDFYHEDISYPFDPSKPTYSIPGYVNVLDFGSGQNKVGGVQQERYLTLFISRRLLEEKLRSMGLDPYRDVPREEDICRIQSMFWEAIDVDPIGYHSNIRYYPFEMNIKIRPYTPVVTTTDGRSKIE